MEIGYSLASEKLELTHMVQSGSVPCGPDPERHPDVIRMDAGAGYDAVFVHQIGSDQEGFLRFFAEEVLPKV